VIYNQGWGGVFTVGGAASAPGAAGGGSGGAIRLIADTIAGQADLLTASGAVGGTCSGSEGRIRLE
jgi:hypothetical protein